MQATKPQFDVVVADDRLFSHAGVGLLAELADRLGLAWALDRFAVGTRLTQCHPVKGPPGLISPC